MRRLNAMEQCARNIAMEHNGDMITESDYLAPLLTMGETGLAAIQNIRPKKERKAPRPKKPSALEHSTAFATLKEVDDFLTNSRSIPAPLFSGMDTLFQRVSCLITRRRRMN
jgi:hypothetical protein